jgi:hypothetical protein
VSGCMASVHAVIRFTYCRYSRAAAGINSDRIRLVFGSSAAKIGLILFSHVGSVHF